MAKYPTMDWVGENIAESFKMFKQRMSLILLDENIVDPAKQAIKIQIAVGTEGLQRLNASTLTDEDKKDPTKIYKLFDDQLNIKVNFRIHRMELMTFRQNENETTDEFVNRARHKGSLCDFGESELVERIIELIVASTPHEQLQKHLDQDKGYSLGHVLTEARKYEAIAAGKQSLQSLRTPHLTVNEVKRRNLCMNCALSHPPRQCPAYRDHCKYCDGIGHWEKCCRKKKSDSRQKSDGRRQKVVYRQQQTSKNRSRSDFSRPPKPIDEMSGYTTENDRDDNDADGGDYTESFYVITAAQKSSTTATRHEVYANLDIVCPDKPGVHDLELKVDTGSPGNTLPVRIARQMYGEMWQSKVETVPNVKLTAYNGGEIECCGVLKILCRYKESQWRKYKFYVVDVDGPAILGLRACEQMHVVTINAIKSSANCPVPAGTAQKTNVTSIEDLKKQFPEQFDRIGSFEGKASLFLKRDARPSIDAPRKCSIHLKARLQQELDTMENDGIIRKIEHHTDWCSSITTSVKKDGSLRVCLDPKRLNDNLKRCPHKIPTLEELNPEFAEALVFSKMDAKAGYWSIHLDEASQEITTFRTPFGRYCYRRLPFGLCVSQDLFQQAMDRILARAPGCVGIADDVVVYGRDNTEHDKNLLRLMQVAKEEGLVFNSKKCVIKTSEIVFFGSVYGKDGIKPDPSKIEDIRKMPTPQDREDLQRFIGLMNYLAAYIPHFADKVSPLRELLKKDVPFVWHEDHQRTYDDLKRCIGSESCLSYYHPQKETVLEVDASQKGLGACLLQDNKPVAFASKTLTPTQSAYSNIERDTLAIVNGVTKFHTYLFGKPFVIITDHKPLLMIHSKPLRSAPPRLQRLLVKIQGYDFQLVYRPGNQMIIADVLSRLPNPEKNDEIPLDVTVDDIMLEVDDENACSIDLINFSINKRMQLREMSTADHTLCALQRVVYSGWPDTIKDLPKDLRPYWSYRDEIGISDGVIFKGKQVIIPDAMRSDILHQLHEAHLEIEKTRLLMRESVYWPNIYKDIEMMVNAVQSARRARRSIVNNLSSLTMCHPHRGPRWPAICSRSKGTIICLLPIITPSFILSRRCTQQPALQSPTSLHSGSACLAHHLKLSATTAHSM